MAYLDFKNLFNYRMNMTRLCLILSFLILFFTQLFMGVRELEDFLVIVIFLLFVNDVIYKYKNPDAITQKPVSDEERNLRKKMTWVLFAIMLFPIILDLFKIGVQGQSLIFKIAFILWAQVFLIDAVLNYKATHLKKWLLYSQTAAMLVLVFSLL